MGEAVYIQIHRYANGESAVISQLVRLFVPGERRCRTMAQDGTNFKTFGADRRPIQAESLVFIAFGINRIVYC